MVKLLQNLNARNYSTNPVSIRSWFPLLSQNIFMKREREREPYLTVNISDQTIIIHPVGR
jgi:hypothetical protein